LASIEIKAAATVMASRIRRPIRKRRTHPRSQSAKIFPKSFNGCGTIPRLSNAFPGSSVSLAPLTALADRETAGR
jgi:hypothetical protein